MSMTDPIADLLTRIRNALMANHEIVDIPHSKIKVAIVKILEQEGFIRGQHVVERDPFLTVKVELKYDSNRAPAIRSLKRISKPGCRVYVGRDKVPLVLGGMGINILSTSSGIMTGKQAVKEGVGGEVLCEVY